MSMKSGRTSRFERNADLERLLGELGELLKPAEELALERSPESSLPLVLIVGPPRSGTTLVMQWLAASGAFAYPTNLLSRFFHAPAVGARIQQLLADPRFAHRDELAGIAHELAFDSDLGKTQGPLAPNEFWYFWRRFLPTTDIEPLGAKLGDVDFQGLRTSLSALADVFGQPLAMKGMMVQYDIEAFARELPNSLFLHVEREACANTRSILDARTHFFGDPGQWYSAKPPEYEALKDLTPAQQVAGQVVYTNDCIRVALENLPEARSLHVPYERFCDDPASIWSVLVDIVASNGSTLPETHPSSATFKATRSSGPTLADDVQSAILELTQESRIS